MAVYKNVNTSDQTQGGEGTTEQNNDIFGQRFTGSISDYLSRSTDNEIFQKGDPCSSQGKLGQINNSLQKLFVVLRGVQAYGDFYINTATNAVANLKSTIYSITGVISGVLKSLVQRLRNWVLNKLKSIITYFLEMILTNFLKTFKESIIAGIIDQIFCSFESIIKGLFGLVGDFLYSLIGQVVQTPFCAAEQWTNALINRLVADIDSALKPVFEQIEDIIQGAGTIFGSVSSAIDTILGFQGFLCGGPQCPEIKEFSLSPWGGPTKTQKDNFSNFNFGISPSFPGEIAKTADDALNDFFGEDSNSSQSPGECYTGNFECGLPQVVIFGGGGSGAVASAVVNTVGEVIGTNPISGGSGYTSPPFVQIVDPAGCGSNAFGFVEMEKDENGYETGRVGTIVIDNGGTGYNSNTNGGSPVIQTFFGTPNPVAVDQSINLSWEVLNADKIFIKNRPLYNNLPLIGNLSFPVLLPDVSFDPGKDQTTMTITLVAQINNTNSTRIEVEQDLIITVKKGEVKSDPLFPLPPKIKYFRTKSTRSTAVPGELITLEWDTLRSEKTTIKNDPPLIFSENEGIVVLPESGELTVVIPQNIVLPSNGAGQVISFELKVENDNAIESQNDDSIIQTDSRTLDITVSREITLDPEPEPEPEPIPEPEPEPEPIPEPEPEPEPIPEPVILPELSLQKIVLSDNGADEAGDIVSYSIIVTNTGNQDLTNVVVTDPLTNFSTTIESLAVNSEQTFSTEYTLTQNDLDSYGGGDGRIENTASAYSDQTDSVSSTARVAVNILIVPEDPEDPEDPAVPGPEDPEDPAVPDPEDPAVPGPEDPAVPGGPEDPGGPGGPGGPGPGPGGPGSGPGDPGLEDPAVPGGPGGPGTIPIGTGTPGTPGVPTPAVGIIEIIEIIDTGIGYEEDDTVELGDGEGGEFEIGTNPIGQIVDFNIIKPGYGYTTIPKVTIKSKTGAGAKFRSRLKFISLDEFEELENEKLIDPNKLVQIIDCVGKTRPVVGYINGKPYYGPFHYHPSRGVKMVGAVHVSTPHQIIYDTVIESLENVQRVVSSGPVSTTTNTSSAQNIMDTSNSSYGSYGTTTSTDNTINTVTTTTTTPSSSSSGSSGGSSSSSGSSGGSSGGSYGY